MNGFQDKALHTNVQTQVLRTQTTVGRETKNQTILMNQSEEKSEKPHF